MPTPKTTAGQLYLALVEPAVKSWLHDRGFVAGDLLGQRNLLDVIRDDAFQRELHTAMHGAAQLDRQPVERLLKGFATLAGVKWTDSLQRQASAASGEIAKIAPYIQKLAPDVWETLHGSQGTVAGLTKAIAEAHRDRMSPAAAGELAKQIHTRLTAADKTALRGFSMQDLGKLYKELRRQGRIGDAESPEVISQRLLDYAQPLSAVRDALGNRDIDAAIDTFRTIPSEIYENATLSEVENRLRAGEFLAPAGGEFGFAARAIGLPPGVDLDQAVERDRTLRMQAAASPLGNELAARQRMRDAGAPESSLLAFMRQTGANQQLMTPELIDEVRRQQMAVDLQPQIQQQNAMTGSHPALAAGNLEEVAARAGYQSAAEMQALHGPAAQAVPSIRDWVTQRSQQAAQVSGLGAHGPATRIIDAVQNATPATTGKDLLGAGLNVIPQADLPKPLPIPKLGESNCFDIKTITPKRTLQREELHYFEQCPHCEKEIGEKETYVDPDGYEYHRPCQDKGPIGFSESARKLQRLMERRPDLRGVKESACGDELAFKYWKARGFSAEVADYLAGSGEDMNTPKGELCPECGARQEYSSDDEKCNRCGKHYPPAKLAVYDRAGVKQLIEAAVADCETPKSEEQAKAGNYAKGHLHVYGLPITIETGKGMTRSGTSKSGKKWSTKMRNSYGYVCRTESEADGDHLDVFLNDDDPVYEKAFVIDQFDPETGEFDEHKTMLFFPDAKSAKAAYLANYDAGWEGFGGIKEMSLDEFKDWIKDGDTANPVATKKTAWELLLHG